MTTIAQNLLACKKESFLSDGERGVCYWDEEGNRIDKEVSTPLTCQIGCANQTLSCHRAWNSLICRECYGEGLVPEIDPWDADSEVPEDICSPCGGNGEIIPVCAGACQHCFGKGLRYLGQNYGEAEYDICACLEHFGSVVWHSDSGERCEEIENENQS